ncbi:hypothetical protein LTS09_011845 [Friedmanniomyces endolithicus]|nr:hypothetical protein LTS09_011845 [Friedmanniomyces endolithicus]KAK0836066.1 hypothetical protein LTR73_000567 [Friedmanniomyces endolithicus]
MAPTKYTTRTIPRISLANFPARLDAITTQLLHTAETDGFFSLTDTEITLPEITAIFSTSAILLRPPLRHQSLHPLHARQRRQGGNPAAKTRPSTGRPRPKRKASSSSSAPACPTNRLPETALPGFKTQRPALHAESPVPRREKLMRYFARGLGSPDDDFFVRAHDPSRPASQSVLRLLHYFAIDASAGPLPETYYGAGALADWDLLTLPFPTPWAERVGNLSGTGGGDGVRDGRRVD